MLRGRFVNEDFDYLLEDFSDEFEEEFVDKKKVKRVFVAS